LGSRPITVRRKVVIEVHVVHPYRSPWPLAAFEGALLVEVAEFHQGKKESNRLKTRAFATLTQFASKSDRV